MLGKTNVKVRPNKKEVDPILENTKLLMHFNDSLYDATGKNTPTMDGTEQYGTGKFDNAIYIDRKSCVQMPLTPELTLGENDFTIAGWFYFETLTYNGCLFSCSHYVNSNYQWQGVQVWLGTSNGNICVCCDIANNVKNRVDTTTNLKRNTWHHVALVRHGNSVTLYVDGQSITSLSVSGAVYQNSNSIWRIGASNARTSSTTSTDFSEPITGLIDEFIIVNGLAVWTENFTPPENPYSEVVI